MSKKAVAVLKGDKVNGVVKFFQEAEDQPVTVEYEINNLPEGKHGFHVHVFGDTTNGCISAGAHFNPFNKDHGAPSDSVRHVGDLGNVESSGSSSTKGKMSDQVIGLFSKNCIIGRTMIVHADEDDLGKGGHDDSKTTGHAGSRIACGVIGITE